MKIAWRERRIMFAKRVVFPSLLFFLFVVFAGSAYAESVQRAYAERPVKLYEEPMTSSKSKEVTLPEGGVNVPSAVRKNGELWYKIEINGRTGWLRSEGIYLKMGPKSKVADNIYKHYAKTRNSFFDGKGPGSEWEMRAEALLDEGKVFTWASKGAVIQSMSTDRSVVDLYFAADNKKACKKFLGFEAIGMSETELRKKMGTPTARGARVLYYELPNMDAALSFTLKNEKVVLAEYSAKPSGGDAWPEDVIDVRGFRK